MIDGLHWPLIASALLAAQRPPPPLMGSLRLLLIPYICIQEKNRGRKRCIITAIDRQWISLFQGSVDRSSEKWCDWNNNRFSGVLQKHSDWCSWRWHLFSFAREREREKKVFPYKNGLISAVVFYSQVLATLVLVFVSLAWGDRCGEKRYKRSKQWRYDSQVALEQTYIFFGFS